MAREESQRMAGVHNQSLFVCHRSQILHGQTVLGPVLEHGPIASVCDEFVRMLRDPRVEVVLYHRHYRRRLCALCGILPYGTGIHGIVRTEAVHVYASVVLQLSCEFRSQHRMLMFRKIPQCITEREFLLSIAEQVLAPGRMVHRRVISLRLRKFLRNAGKDVAPEFLIGH